MLKEKECLNVQRDSAAQQQTEAENEELKKLNADYFQKISILSEEIYKMKEVIMSTKFEKDRLNSQISQDAEQI